MKRRQFLKMLFGAPVVAVPCVAAQPVKAKIDFDFAVDGRTVRRIIEKINADIAAKAIVKPPAKVEG